MPEVYASPKVPTKSLSISRNTSTSSNAASDKEVSTPSNTTPKQDDEEFIEPEEPEQDIPQAAAFSAKSMLRSGGGYSFSKRNL